MRDIKEKLGYVALDFAKEMEASTPTKTYELPDKECITIGEYQAWLSLELTNHLHLKGTRCSAVPRRCFKHRCSPRQTFPMCPLLRIRRSPSVIQMSGKTSLATWCYQAARHAFLAIQNDCRENWRAWAIPTPSELSHLQRGSIPFGRALRYWAPSRHFLRCGLRGRSMTNVDPASCIANVRTRE